MKCQVRFSKVVGRLVSNLVSLHAGFSIVFLISIVPPRIDVFDYSIFYFVLTTPYGSRYFLLRHVPCYPSKSMG